MIIPYPGKKPLAFYFELRCDFYSLRNCLQGRMAMVDVLCHMKEKALKEKNPHLMTIATLTGHEVMAYGPYTAIMDNGCAKM